MRAGNGGATCPAPACYRVSLIEDGAFVQAWHGVTDEGLHSVIAAVSNDHDKGLFRTGQLVYYRLGEEKPAGTVLFT